MVENSTLVHVRTDGPTERITLADIPRIERMLLRRADVFRRWDEFLAESWNFARSVGLDEKCLFSRLARGNRKPLESVPVGLQSRRSGDIAEAHEQPRNGCLAHAFADMRDDLPFGSTKIQSAAVGKALSTLSLPLRQARPELEGGSILFSRTGARK